MRVSAACGVWALCVLGLSGCMRAPVKMTTLQSWARESLSADGAQSKLAIQKLREAGPRSLDAMVWLKGQLKASELRRYHRALDRVAAHYRSENSRLFWFKRLERAKAHARKTGKPILSLHLLGQFERAYTCANSRFFRTILYLNPKIARILRRRFVLHWKSVRPVPVITIRFGSKRVLKRTITGNSIHYVLDSQGRVLDALPGLQSAQMFRDFLGRALVAAKASKRWRGPTFARWRRQYHTRRWRQIMGTWRRSLSKLSLDRRLRPFLARRVRALDAAAPKPKSRPPSAPRAARVAVGKSRAEVPILQRMRWASRRARSRHLEQLRRIEATIPWSRIAGLWRAGASLDAAARARILSEVSSPSGQASRHLLSAQKAQTLIRGFEDAVALDTVRNVFLHGLRIHAWFSLGTAPQGLKALNRAVYARIFLTPHSDPWLGMFPKTVYSALPGRGVILR